MKKSLFNKLLILIFTIISVQLRAQDYKISFAILGSDEVPDSVQVANIDQNINLTLKGDNVLHLVNTWLHIYPNPMQQNTTLEFYNTQEGNVSISIFDVEGRKLVQNSSVLSKGNCVYKLSGLGMGTFIVNISTNSSKLSAKVISIGESSLHPTIELLEVKEQGNSLKSGYLIDANIVEMQYNEGERLKFTAYLKSMTSVQEDIPTSNKTITFDFSTDADDPYMMPYYTGKILPTPQNAEYKNEYVSLANTAIILNNIRQDDPRLKYLLERITIYGGKYHFVTEANEEHTCVIKINDETLNSPQNPQGYIIKSNGKIFSLKGTDFQGLLWAISSLNQMIFVQNGETVIRLLDVMDWPDTKLRGMLPESVDNIKQYVHLMVAFKLNLVDFRAGISKDGEHAINWRLPRTPIFQERLNEIQESLTALRFEWYAGARFLGYDQVPQINSGSEPDFDIIYNNFALPIARAGGNLSVQFDDLRFPIHPDDTTRFGSAAKADHYLLTKLYEKLKSNYPDIKIAFTPPFYWGPTAPNPYPESRDNYLNMTGTLPNAFDIYWTGPSVRSETVVQADVQWETDRINRKPLIFQNKIGTPHDFDYHYMTDPIYSLKDWYYNGFLKDTKAYMLNGGDINKSGAVVSISDWTWNTEKFEPEPSIKDAIMKLTGPEAYPILSDMNTQLSAFDTYLPDVTFRAIRHLNDFNNALDNLEILNESLKKINGESIEFWTAVNSSHIDNVRHFVEKVNLASQDPIVQQIIGRADASVTMYFAVIDANFDPNTTDILIEPVDFTGAGVLTYGYYNADAGILLEDRPTAIITGAGVMSANFNINTIPPAGYQLIITGADDFLPDNCPIKIELNGNVIFNDAPNTFLNTAWNTNTFTIPAADVNVGNNVLTITNTSLIVNFDAPPAFLVNYAILREMP